MLGGMQYSFGQASKLTMPSIHQVGTDCGRCHHYMRTSFRLGWSWRSHGPAKQPRTLFCAVFCKHQARRLTTEQCLDLPRCILMHKPWQNRPQMGPIPGMVC